MTGPLSVSAGAHFASDTVTIDRIGQIAEDGAITLTGTYRCSSPRLGPVLIGSKAVQGDARASLDGIVANCDGQQRTWRATGQASGTFRPGAARGEATLIQLDLSHGLVPFPTVLTAGDTQLTLQRG
ncbi:DUF6299 family protein [Streptomyces albipurpureus]|uniref:DUF6299 family protein n=1 Tax=Streptomyces albipurpureus TaxID=2897419 RepID=A0ABT0UQ20_9ACTN|nr:DUF6299 family protein [Streptomyces sp. CWNU-1]MCM2390702.1 DUF6299 family protein [Streptomyces sp. CWNU-1]